MNAGIHSFMPSLALVASKGGVGKSTIATNLAALAGPDAWLVDLDDQRTAADWHSVRTKAGVDAPRLATGDPTNLARALAAMPAEAWIIVDTAPGDLEAAKLVAAAVNFVIIPAAPTFADLRAIVRTVAIVKAASASAVIVLNRVQPGRSAAEAVATADARRALNVYQLAVCPAAIGDRIAYARAMNAGQSVAEYEPDGKAAQEIETLWSYIDAQARRR